LLITKMTEELCMPLDEKILDLGNKVWNPVTKLKGLMKNKSPEIAVVPEATAEYWQDQKQQTGLLWQRPELGLQCDYHKRLRHQVIVLPLEFFQIVVRRETRPKILLRRSVSTLAVLAASMTCFGIQAHQYGQRALASQLAAQPEQLLNQISATQNEASSIIPEKFSAPLKAWQKKSGDVNQAVRCSLNTPLSLATLNHAAEVWDVRFSADGTRVATASSDKTARVWDAQTGELIATLNHAAEVWDVRFSADGTRVVTASADKTARVWDAQTGRTLVILNHDDGVRAVSFSPDGARVATASADKTARVWDAQTGALLATLNHNHWVNAVSFSPDGAQVATASVDNTARVWNAQTGEPLAILNHDAQVWAVSFSPDGTRVATASVDNTARVWDCLNR
jgi:dipeptidyl aminopeptidase/acylaminoacyl peptidase